MPSDADKNLASFSAVTDAFRAFPTPIFSIWLRFRRHSADQYFPRWRTTEDKKQKVALLDISAALGAAMN